MFDENTLCPFCKSVCGRVHSTDPNNSTIRVLKNPPKNTKAKERTFQSKCHHCGKLIYIILGFID